MEPQSLATPTRQLAQRDMLLAAKINELVRQTNNTEQFVALPTARVTLPPAVSEVVINYRIPPGFEARVFNAIVASSPTGIGRLEIYHNADSDASSKQFGNTSGTSVVTTSDEFTNGASFWPTGEFAIRVFNDGGVSADVSASVTVSIRPVGETDGNLISPGVIGQRGPKGDRGDTGPGGGAGPKGDTGTAGLTWKGVWSNTATYLPNDVVFYDSGLGGSSYRAMIAINPNINPTVTTHWEYLARAGQGYTGPAGPAGPAGITGSAGPQGTTGAPGPQGVGFTYFGYWTEQPDDYEQGAVVTVANDSFGTTVATYLARGATPGTLYPPTSPEFWGPLFSDSPVVLSTLNSPSGSLTQGFGYTAPVSPPYPYATLATGGSVANWSEMVSASVGIRSASLQKQYRLQFSGSVLVKLPSANDELTTNASFMNWNNTNTVCQMSVAGYSATGSNPFYYSQPKEDTAYWGLYVAGSVPQSVNVLFLGQMVDGYNASVV